mgnify:CR=1 FL=1
MAQVYDAYLPLVNTICRHGFGTFRGFFSPSDRDDAVQGIFVAAFEERTRLAYNGLDPYSSFLRGVARNVIRKMLEFASVVESPFMQREYRRIQVELAWLDDGDTASEAAELWRRWLPFADVDLFHRSLEALRSNNSHLQLYGMGRRLHASLRGFSIVSNERRFAAGSWRFVRFLFHRFFGRRQTIVPMTGGAIIAFVAGDASGKSSMLSKTHQWLGEFLTVETVHAGKPPPTWITAIPRLLLPLMRTCFPKTRTNTVEFDLVESNDNSATKRQRSLLYVIRLSLIHISETTRRTPI